MLTAKLLWKQTFPIHHQRISVHYLRAVRGLFQRQSPPIPPFPTVECCPPGNKCLHPTPSDIGINTKKTLSGTTPPYKQHVVICTGKDEWASRIEKEEGPNFARGLKELVGPKGEFHDPYNNIIISNSSFSPTRPDELREAGGDSHPRKGPSTGIPDNVASRPSTELPQKNDEFTAAYLFPSFQYIPHIRNTPEGHRAFVQNFLLPTQKPHQSPPQTAPKSQRPPSTHPTNSPPSSSLLQPIILICGHGTRDRRCGIFGPLLRSEFQHHLSTIPISNHAPPSLPPTDNVALISHIGGHAFAGNVIIYFPPGFRHHYPPPPSPSPTEPTEPQPQPDMTKSFEISKLSGTGIWYGRVEPRHVQGILDATVMRGMVIEELFRGGVVSGKDGFETVRVG